MRPTVRMTRSPTVMLIGATQALAAACDNELPIPALRVAHIAAAVQRIPVTRPLIVAIFGSMHHIEEESLRDACTGTGSLLIEVEKDITITDLKNRVACALVALENRSG